VQLLIEICEFPNNTSPREWLARENYLAIQAQEACFVNRWWLPQPIAHNHFDEGKSVEALLPLLKRRPDRI